ncbi:MAG: hypothetical protein IKP00_04290 [Victivallales bacterium]|nr:hypothetical protein [Victivallales bacterium]
MYYQVLNHQLKGWKLGKAPVNEQFDAKVRDAFTKAATAFVAKVGKYCCTTGENASQDYC